VQIVQTSGEHLLRMINEVLDLSKIEAGRMELSPVAFHLPQLLRDSAAAISTRARTEAARVRLRARARPPRARHGDPVKLRQVIDNLLSNAVKFTARGRIRLQAADHVDPAATRAVRGLDTGVGIGEPDRAKLFQPFHQAAEGRPPEPGTGLGLAISQRMVALMGGTLAVESAPGAGQHVLVCRAPARGRRRRRRRDAPRTRLTGYRGPRRRVLVVDDVATNRDVLRELLAPLDFVITEAATGAEALAATREARPDLVLLDLQMPGMNGFELARALRREADGAPLKLIAMSASVLSLKRQDAFDAGCDDFLAKPFREDDLLARLGRLLALEWVSEAPEPVRPSRSPFGVTTTRLSPAELEELLACARRGEITQLRRRLAAHPGDPLAATIEGLARNYRMAQIRELLAQQVARAGAASGPPAGG
jgi:CheY-like chemotaxis protein